jgi:uncharacterized protein YydD (DUF2326 family)
MLKSLRSNNPLFRQVVFRPGFNVVLADRVLRGEDDSKKTRNGAGKSTLIDIIHFCLGSNVDSDTIFKNDELKGWSFFLDFSIGNVDFTVERSVDHSSVIIVHQPQLLCWEAKRNTTNHYSVRTFNENLLDMFFGLSNDNEKKSPSFRELISYNIRRRIGGYSKAFEFFKPQPPYSVMACNAYFLDLNLDFVYKREELSIEKKEITSFVNAAKSGVVKNFSLDIGKLDTEVIATKAEAESLKKQIDSFRVHPQYLRISDEANRLTKEIHDLTDDLTFQKQYRKRYDDIFRDDSNDISTEVIQHVYEEAGIYFSGDLKLRLNEVIEFHKKLLQNRKAYLNSEINNIEGKIKNMEAQIKFLTDRRADNLEVLKTHGALEEFTKLQERYSKLRQEYEDAKMRKSIAAQFQSKSIENKIQTAQLIQFALADLDDRQEARERAVNIFIENSRSLYQNPGTLTIEVRESGYKFDVEIKSSKSQGVNYMKVFCYDMLLAQLGARRDRFPKFLIHDSIIFDGVDERQKALALKLAHQKCEQLGFQYICMLNSDAVPENEFDDYFKDIFNQSVILRLDDSTDSGGLLGMRF